MITSTRCLVLVIAAALALSGCTMSPEQKAEQQVDLQERADTELGSLPGVLSVAATVATGVSVTVTETLTSDQLVTLAEATRLFVEDNDGSEHWVGEIAMEVVDRVPDDDMPAQTRMRLEVFPTVVTGAGADAAEVMVALSTEGVESVVLVGGDPFVTVTSATTLQTTLDTVGTLDLWAAGGTLWAEAGRVRLRSVPDRLTPLGMSTIIQSSIAYPAVQFWLEAPLDGPQWPRLYVDQVSTEDAAAIAAGWQDAALPPMTTIDGYDVEFNIRVIGNDGPTDTWGAIGVPAA